MNVIVKTVDYRGRTFDGFYACKSATDGPGFYVFGGNAEYNGRLRMLCARPDVKPRRYKYYNGKVQRGWNTKREAQAIADNMNAATVPAV